MSSTSIGGAFAILSGVAVAVLRRPLALWGWTIQKAFPGGHPPVRSGEVAAAGVAVMQCSFGVWFLISPRPSPAVGALVFTAAGGLVACFNRGVGRLAWHLDRMIGVKSSDPVDLASMYRTAGITVVACTVAVAALVALLTLLGG